MCAGNTRMRGGLELIAQHNVENTVRRHECVRRVARDAHSHGAERQRRTYTNYIKCSCPWRSYYYYVCVRRRVRTSAASAWNDNTHGRHVSRFCFCCSLCADLVLDQIKRKGCPRLCTIHFDCCRYRRHQPTQFRRLYETILVCDSWPPQ